MTVIAGVNQGAFALLATDNRALVSDETGKHYEDTDVKLYSGEMGMLAGTGLEFYIKAAAKVLERGPGESFFEFGQRLGILRAGLRGLREVSPLVAQAFDTTRFLFATPVLDEMQILFWSPQHNESTWAGSFPPGDVGFSAPFGAKEGEDTAWQKEFRAMMRPNEDFGSLGESVAYHAALLRGFVHWLSRRYETVSDAGIIGIMLPDGRQAVQHFEPLAAPVESKAIVAEAFLEDRESFQELAGVAA